DSNLVPIGVPGELWIGGAGLALGYLGRPDLTAAAFRPDPFAAWPGARLYRTGDLARRLADGSYEFLGRLDQQVKVRGFRIELGDVEAHLARHPAVRAAVAATHESAPGDHRIVAYLVAASQPVPGPDELRRFLAGSLPEYMLPAAWVWLEALPLTPNGKVDRKALPRPDADRPDLAAVFVAPRNELERSLAAAWREVLGTEEVGIHDNFFDLGGHSLLGTRLMSRVESRLGVALPLRALFEAPTVEALAARIEGTKKNRRLASPLAAGARPAELPLSFAQERLWFLDQIDGPGAAYNIPCAVYLHGVLDTAALGRALGEVVRRHEVLRTRFEAVAGEPRQVIEPPLPVPLPVVDAAGVPEAETLRLARAEAARPFDLTCPPLLRACLLRRGAGDHLLVLTLHHVAADGWSLGVLVRELVALYQGEALEDLPLQYADFALWQRHWLSGDTLTQEVAWWRERLAGAPEEAPLPTDRPRDVSSSQGGRCRTTLPSAELGALCRERQATLFMVLLTAFAALLSRWSHEEDLVVGSPVANRNRVETEGLIGFFVNMLPLRVDLSGQPTFAALLARVREVTLAAHAHQDLPFEKLVEALQPVRHLGRTPLFQVSLTLQNAPFAAVEVPGLSWSPLPVETETAKFDLTLSLAEEAGGLAAALEYRTDLFERPTMLRLLEHFRVLLAAAAIDPGLRLGQVPLLTAPQAHQLRSEWNDSAIPHTSDLCLHDLVLAQSRRTPRALAVRCGDERLTYEELAGRALRLASHLRAQGIAPGQRVGVAVDRSEEMVVALLGVLVAGAAYVPLDPAFPQERLALMIEDACPTLLLTQERLAGALPQGAPLLFLEQVRESPARVPEAAPTTPGDLAYVLYTSGSTGRPKGVAIPHRAVVNFLDAVRRSLGLAAHDTMVALTTLSFDIAVLEIFLPLSVGATVAVATREQARGGAELRQFLADPAVTVLQATPATWRLLLEAGWEGNPRLKALCGGEALSSQLADLLVERCGELWNLYGPTETTVWSMAQRVASSPGDAGTVPVGRPLGNSDIHL
ncbi:MAG TPA: condensation domain-containing protein, partial [Thermoanaerobaculia bacterium]|nr:condensation domain-containing protein [Thermoanaerobaculia bacterium]